MKLLNKIIFAIVTVIAISCSRADEDLDVLSQEDISNIIIHVKDDSTGKIQTYNYAVNSAENPLIKLTDGKSYTVNAVFLNGNKDETESIKAAKDEHFLIFQFQWAEINLTRIDDESSTRADGQKLGLITKWNVIKAKNSQPAQLNLTLIHDAVSVSSEQSGNTFGTASGGETDAVATFEISDQ